MCLISEVWQYVSEWATWQPYQTSHWYSIQMHQESISLSLQNFCLITPDLTRWNVYAGDGQFTLQQNIHNSFKLGPQWRFEAEAEQRIDDEVVGITDQRRFRGQVRQERNVKLLTLSCQVLEKCFGWTFGVENGGPVTLEWGENKNWF